jgi:hypothetical protein
VLGAGLRRMAKIVARYPTTLVMLNQVRDNVGVMFGDKKTTPGGNPPHFYASLELYLKGSSRVGGGFVRSASQVPPLTKEAIKRLGLYDYYDKSGKARDDKGAVLGRYITANVTKTKMSTTLQTHADFYIDFRKGVHRWEGLAERLMFEGLLKCGPDGASDYEMVGLSGLEVLGLPADDIPLTFPDKKAWLNWLAQNLGVLATPASMVEPGTAAPTED